MNPYNKLRSLFETEEAEPHREPTPLERVAAAGRGETITPEAKRATTWFKKKGYVKIGGKWVKSKSPGGQPRKK